MNKVRYCSVKLRCLLVLGSFFFHFVCFAKHEVHVAVFTIECSSVTNSFDILVKADKNNLVDLVGVRYGYHIDLQEKIDADDLKQIKRFVDEQFRISQAGSKIELEIDSISFDTEYAWLYLETKSSEVGDRVLIRNQFMLNAFKDQKNLVIFVCGDYEKGVIFDAVTTSYEFELKNN